MYQRASTRKYDSCYYEFFTDISDEQMKSLKDEKTTKIEIQLSVTKAKQMNVYLYAGKSRFEATESVVENNAPVELDKVYSIDHNTGFLLVAYPNEGKATDFEFTYKIAATHEDRNGNLVEDMPVTPGPFGKLPSVQREWWEGEEGE